MSAEAGGACLALPLPWNRRVTTEDMKPDAMVSVSVSVSLGRQAGRVRRSVGGRMDPETNKAMVFGFNIIILFKISVNE